MAKRPVKHTTPVDRMQKAATDLVRFHERRSKKAGALSATATKRQKALLANFEAAADLVRMTATPSPPEAVDIVDFFNKVSAGVVNAQRNLDEQSADYLKTVAAQPHALPSIFRIPKVTAEMKFALQTSKKTGIDLLFYKDLTQAQELNQQTLQFDIVAAPPPPNLMAPPALVSIVRLKSDRQMIQKAVGLPASVSDFDRVIILEIIDRLQNGMSGTATRQYVLLFADGDGRLGLWWLQIVMTRGASKFGAILPFTVPDPSLASLQTFVSAAGDSQKDFLSKLP
jgi:hypothetical protein